MTTPSPVPDGVDFGTAYYPEYQPGRDPETDLDLMAAAGFTVIRVGESVWSTWEPSDGRFDLEWLAPVLDGAHRRGLRVVLGTPTYAVPPWLQRKHPELAGESATGRRIPWGGRQEVDYTSGTFRHYAERIIRAVVGRYARHPAVVGFQVDNEPGLRLFHNRAVRQEFARRLEREFGSIEELNEQWGLVYWSHRLNGFDELWAPDGNTFPQYDLAWRRFQADLTNEFIRWQVGIVREYATSRQFVTTCVAYSRPAQHDALLAEELDVFAGNAYYEVQDGLDLATPSGHSDFVVSGVGAFLRQADQLWASADGPYLVTETNAQSIGAHSFNQSPHPGQLAQAAFGLISRGARMIEYWHWQTLHGGAETYWGGVLPHSGVPGRIYREVAQLGSALAAVGPALAGYAPDYDATILWSNASKWALEFSPALRDEHGRPDPQSYTRIVDAFHAGVVEIGGQARIVHDTRVTRTSAAHFAAAHPLLLVPGLYVVDDELQAWLAAYVAAGGHLVLGPKSLYADGLARARREVAPPGLAESAGFHYDEFSNLRRPLAVRAADGFDLTPGAAATAWIEGYEAEHAETLAWYEHEEFGRFSAVVTRSSGNGRITAVGTVPNRALARDVARWLIREPVAADWRGSAQHSAITVMSGTADAGRLRFVHNWSGSPQSVELPAGVVDLVDGTRHPAGSVLPLHPRDARILLEERDRT